MARNSLYEYAHTSPLVYVDPRGLQAEQPGEDAADGEACACQEALRRNNVDTPYQVGAGQNPQVRRLGPCRVVFGCARDCGPTGGHLGWTELPNADRIIFVCVARRLELPADYDVVIAHEKEHARRFCTLRPGPVRDDRRCEQVEREERHAYTASCRLLYDTPEQRDDYQRCIRCGVNIALSNTIVNGRPCAERDATCGNADIGIRGPVADPPAAMQPPAVTPGE